VHLLKFVGMRVTSLPNNTLAEELQDFSSLFEFPDSKEMNALTYTTNTVNTSLRLTDPARKLIFTILGNNPVAVLHGKQMGCYVENTSTNWSCSVILTRADEEITITLKIGKYIVYITRGVSLTKPEQLNFAKVSSGLDDDSIEIVVVDPTEYGLICQIHLLNETVTVRAQVWFDRREPDYTYNFGIIRMEATGKYQTKNSALV
jgi:hypothetical protein